MENDIQKTDSYQEIKKKADNFMREKKYKEAIETYKEIIKVHGENNIIYSNMSEAYLKINDYKNGLIYAEYSLDLENDNIKSIFRKMRALNGLEKYNTAILFYESFNLQDYNIKELDLLKEEMEQKLNKKK